MNEFTIPERPLDRFIELYDALRERKKWYESVMPLRYSALTLATVPGSAREITERIFAIADDLKSRAGWFGPLNSPIRFAVAAVLHADGDSAASFCKDVERIQKLMREEKMRRGAAYEVLAIMILRRTGERRSLSAVDVRRFAALFRRLREDHRWLTGADDYPMCALLSATGDPVEEIGPRVESCYRALRQGGLSQGNPLQSASHILYFCPRETKAAVEQFLALRDEFRAAKIRIFQTDYDELAALAFLDHDARAIVARVKEHRVPLSNLRPKPDRNTSFSLACGTTFLDLVRRDRDFKEIHDARLLVQIQGILAAQQAAAVAAVAATSAAAAASSS